MYIEIVFFDLVDYIDESEILGVGVVLALDVFVFWVEFDEEVIFEHVFVFVVEGLVAGLDVDHVQLVGDVLAHHHLLHQFLHGRLAHQQETACVLTLDVVVDAHIQTDFPELFHPPLFGRVLFLAD